MKADIWFICLTQKQREELKDKNHPTSKLYHSARGGIVNSDTIKLYQKVSELSADDYVDVWVKLQSFRTTWDKQPNVKCFTSYPRSIEWGDVIVWENHHVEQCCGPYSRTLNVDLELFT